MCFPLVLLLFSFLCPIPITLLICVNNRTLSIRHQKYIAYIFKLKPPPKVAHIFKSKPPPKVRFDILKIEDEAPDFLSSSS